MSDDLQRRGAVDPDRSVIVQAPAGSGKTTLLVERFLALLARVEEPEEILAMTFTRKAAAEMRERILKFLDPQFAPDPHERAAAERARALDDKVERWNLRTNPERLMIRTIDSFSHWLVRTMPVASRLGPVPQPVDNAQALYRRAARRVIEALDETELAAELNTVLGWRDHRSQELEQLLTSLLGKREQWLRALKLTGTPDRRDFERVLETVVRQRLRRTARALNEALAAAPAVRAELVALLGLAADNLRAGGIESDLCMFDADRDMPGDDLDCLPQWKALAEGFPPTARKEKARFQAVLEALSDNEALAAELHGARKLPDARYESNAQWQVLEALIRVLERAAGELELLFAETGQSDFTGLSRAALTGLGDDDNDATDLALYLDQRINHILVDEFQDTNWAQLHLLERLTRGWQDGDGRTLFLVGDPMQSIYRFREAEVGLFMRTRDRGVGAVRPDSLKLTRNFRARAELVDFVNRVLGPSFPVEEDIAAGAVAYAPSEPGRESGGRIDILAAADAVTEAEQVAALLASELAAHAGDPDWKAAIIVRARTHLRELLPALANHRVGYRAVKLDPLLQRPVVRDLLALARAIHIPDDRSACLAVLRAPYCGLELADLHALAGDGADPFDETALDRLSAQARQRAERVYRVLHRARAETGRRSLRERVEGAWHRLGGPQLLARPATDRADAAMLLDVLEKAEAEGLLDDWNELIERLDREYTAGDPPSDEVKVELLTLHAAKGLEWDLVVLPGLNRKPRSDDKELLYWLPFTQADDSERVLLAPLRAAWEPNNSALIELIRSERNKREAYEQQRLLYVAATRARERLVLSAALDPERQSVKPVGGSLLELLWPRAAGEFLAALDATRDNDERGPAAAKRPNQDLRRAPAGWEPPIGTRLDWRPKLPPREREIEIEFNWAGTQARRSGTVLHQLLEQVGRSGIENLDADRRRALVERIPRLLRALGTGPVALEAITRQVQGAFEQTLDSTIGRWILSAGHSDGSCELALTGVVDGELVNAVIDRSFIDEHGTRWIIDYKSGHHAGGNLDAFLENEAERYRDQLGLYRRLFEQMGERDIKTALYLPRHGVLKEVP
jgi:ATP-dependent exoDNAse (exonuclease V) beta subunit